MDSVIDIKCILDNWFLLSILITLTTLLPLQSYKILCTFYTLLSSVKELCAFALRKNPIYLTFNNVNYAYRLAIYFFLHPTLKIYEYVDLE